MPGDKGELDLRLDGHLVVPRRTSDASRFSQGLLRVGSQACEVEELTSRKCYLGGERWIARGRVFDLVEHAQAVRVVASSTQNVGSSEQSRAHPITCALERCRCGLGPGLEDRSLTRSSQLARARGKWSLGARESEIHHAGLPLRVDHHVVGLEVSVAGTSY
jgi:hypothetical protein